MVRRQDSMPFKYSQVSDFILKFPHNVHQKSVCKAREKANVNLKWGSHQMGQEDGCQRKKCQDDRFGSS